jgi:tyrosyl-tRNA synthetase
MSQTVGNYVGVAEQPSEMYGKILSIPDELLSEYFFQLTDLKTTEYQTLIDSSPRDAKRLLARTIVTQYHDIDAANAAEQEFDRIHIQHERPSEIDKVKIARELLKDGNRIWVITLLEASGLVKSRGEAKRLISQGGVRINNERILSADLEISFDPPMLIQVGKRLFVEAV